MIRKARLVIVGAAGVMLLALVAAHAPSVRSLVLRHVVEGLRNSYGIDLRAASLSYNLLTLSAELREIQLAAADTPAEPFAAADALSLSFGVRTLIGFVDEVSNWYVRVNRPRFWAVDAEADPAALATLHEALTAVSRMLAPAAPFLSDWLHRALAGTSVHLARFPVSSGRRDLPLEAAMDAVRRLASLAHSARQQRSCHSSWPAW